MKKRTQTISKITLVMAIISILFLSCFISIQTATASGHVDTLTGMNGSYLPMGQIGSTSRQINVTYNPNGATGKVNTIKVTPNTDYTIEDQGYDKRGYAFGGWATNPEGRGELYYTGQVVRITTPLNLYALWLPTF